MLRWSKGLFAGSVVSGFSSFTDMVPGAELMTKVLLCISASLFLLYLAGSNVPYGIKPTRKLYR